MPEFKAFLTRSKELLSFHVSRRLGYAQNVYIKDALPVNLLVEAAPYLGKGLLATVCWYGQQFSPVLAGRDPTWGAAFSISHEYQATYHEEFNPDPVTPRHFLFSFWSVGAKV